MKKTYLILLFILLASCLPTQQRVAPNFSDIEETSTGTDSASDDTGEESTLFQTNVQWYDSGLSSEILTIGSNNSKTIYLLGDQVHNYLLNSENFAATYCIEARFQITASNTPKILRVKVVPAFSNNFIIGQTTRFFRVNLNTDSGNSFCNKNSKEIVDGVETTIQAGDTNYDGVINGSDNSYVYQTEDICPSCLNILASTDVILYKNNENNTSTLTNDDYLERVDLTQMTYNDLTLRIDMNNTSTGNTNSCSDSACQTNGFDCCVDGQCVNEKSIKTAGVAADTVGFAIAEQEKLVNPNWYKNYPQFYYICLEQVPNDDDTNDDNDPIDPIGEAQARLEALIKDYQCIEDLKAVSQANPFHQDAVGNTNVCATAADTYQNIFKRLYTNCGCSETSDLQTMINACPDYTYEPVYQTDTNGNPTTTIISINCVTPPVDQVPGPFQDLDVVVNSKIAPHRYFDTTNTEIIPGEDLPTGATGIQENVNNELFEYLDDYYIFPRNFSFNMTSILGGFDLNLSQAQPAKIIDIEFDKQYLISTLSGYYSGCPTCAVDSWFGNFSATPGAYMGVGLQAVGYTTRRDSFVSNSKLGNYEDTKFGRACYVPPTMIPFSQTESTSTQTQRLARLKTQAALYVNGYQKDWYGFNRGALIGSFDGVTWFAIGKGRIVKSTSNKLFLAINAPFADLATATNHTVSVQEYDFVSSAPNYDYVPGLEVNNAFQNEAGSCQEFHECETDAHCISKLGWEYVCGDVTYTQTKWPAFNPLDAEETANSSFTGTISQFLQQGELPPGGTTKRCIYRGAGAPCRTDYENIADEGKRKVLTCAPNFYCADLDDSGVFNDEVARFGRPLEELVETNNHLFGQEANILGRPKEYMATGGNLTSLPSDVKAIIEENVLLTDSTATGKVGLCRPGKLLPSYSSPTTTANWDPADQHSTPDPSYRTDYISQIGGCNSALYTDLRYSSCPMLDEDGNYIHTQDGYINDAFYSSSEDNTYSKLATTELYSAAQNSCSLESLSQDAIIGSTISTDLLKDFSAFKTIEGETLAVTNLLSEPTLARDACLRRAGAVCHTDLDCSPNRMMASVVDLVNPSYFGNEAEKLYFEEYLICGQAETAPTNVTDANYNTYTMHNNKCCREIGADLTMYTEDSPAEPISSGLRTDKFGSMNPNDPDRYSRYSSDPTFFSNGEAQFIRPSANTDTTASANITQPLQWRTIHENAARICCGGGWVRKFADGTNDWTQNRMNMDVSNFRCLNYNSPIPLAEDPGAYGLTSTQVDVDLNNYCADPTFANGGCVEQATPGIDNLHEPPYAKPTLDNTRDLQMLFSNPTDMADYWGQTSDGASDDDDSSWAYYNLQPLSGGGDLVLDWSVASKADASRLALRTILPSYVQFDTSTANFSVGLKFPSNADGAVAGVYATCQRESCADGTCGVDSDLEQWTAGSCNNTDGTLDMCCYTYDESSRVLIIAFENEITNAGASYNNDDHIIGMKINYLAPGSLHNEDVKGDAAGVTSAADANLVEQRRSSRPGEALYYLKRLSRLEYAGIPQMTYEPVYCNDNYQKLVPGIFQEAPFGEQLQTVIDFLNHSKTFVDSGSNADPWQPDTANGVYATSNADSLNERRVTTGDMLDQAPIFSDNKFKCCLELGASTTDATMCCSGYAVQDSSNPNLTCKLPTGTNLNVYFNKFVSGEGISDNHSDTVLSEDDFNTKTGEPKTTSDVVQKLAAIGAEFCETGSTRRGGAFGNYPARPRGPIQVNNGVDNSPQYTIVDSIFDEGNINNVGVGYSWFSAGFRWNHHTYCAP